MIPQISLFSNFLIKIRSHSHSTIYTFKNYFATVFSVLVFSFNNNKFNPNEPIRRLHAQFFCKCHLKSPASHRRWEDYRLVKLKKKPSKKKQKNTVNNTAYMIDKLKEVRRKVALHCTEFNYPGKGLDWLWTLGLIVNIPNSISKLPHMDPYTRSPFANVTAWLAAMASWVQLNVDFFAQSCYNVFTRFFFFFFGQIGLASL